MLAVVHDQQQLARPQILDHRRLDAEALLLLQPQRRRDSVAHRCTVVERGEFAEPHAVAEALLVASGGLEGEPRLADAADAGQRHQRALGAGRPLTRSTSRSRPTKLVARRGRSGVAAEVAPTRRPAVRPQHWQSRSPSRICWCTSRSGGLGIDAQLLDEPVAHLPVGVERVGLPAAAVLGEHQLPGQAFVERVGVQRRGELAEQLGVPSGAQRGVVAVQYDGKPFGFAGRCGRRSTHGVSSAANGSPRHRSSALSNRAAASGGSAVRAGLRRPSAGSGAGRPTTASVVST